MKVMLIVARLNVGGVALNVIQFTAALNRVEGVEAMLVHGSIGAQEGDMAYLAEQLKVPTIHIAGLGRELSPRRDLLTVWQLWRLMRRYRPDVVHTHTAKAGFVGRWSAWLARVPVRVHTFHGHVFHGYFSPRKTRLFLMLERLSARISNRIITLSDQLRDEIADTYHVTRRKQIEVMPLGLDLSALFQTQGRKMAFREQYGLSPDKLLIGVVGRLVPIKNHALFLEAAALLRQTRPDVHFVIVGDGECRPAIETQIQSHNLQECVTITGWVNDMPAVYGALDLVTITSDNEGTPVSLIEALAAGVPVVSTDVGGVRDLLGTGLVEQIVPPRDAIALSQAWERTLQAPPAATGGREIAARYDIHQSAQATFALYQHLLQHS